MFNFFKYFSYVMVIIGALNWGLIAFFGYDLVASLFGEMSGASRVIYGIVGISAIISLITSYMCLANRRDY